jgi:hypothetical protein
MGRDYSEEALELAKNCLTSVGSEIDSSEELLELESTLILFNGPPETMASDSPDERKNSIAHYNTIRREGRYENRISQLSNLAFDALFKQLSDDDKPGMIAALLSRLNPENLLTFKEYILNPKKSDLLKIALSDEACMLNLMKLDKGVFEDLYSFAETEYNTENMAFIALADFYLKYTSEDPGQPDSIAWSKFELVKNKLNLDELNHIYEECRTGQAQDQIEGENPLLTYIQRNFISGEGDYQVNIPGTMRRQAEEEENLANALDEITNVVRRDTLMRYVKKRGEEHPDDLCEFYKGIIS